MIRQGADGFDPRKARSRVVVIFPCSGLAPTLALDSCARPDGEGRCEQALGGVDRYRVGLHHVALEASSRAVVDERHEWLVSFGATIESPPQEYAYLPGYYAVFFYDPDGIKLEIVHVPGLAA